MSRAAVFFDIDGTILDFWQNIPESTIDAIRQLRANGHLAFINTGRARGYIVNPKLLEIGFDGIVGACGCYVEMDGKVLYDYIIPKDEAVKTVELVRSYGFRPILEGPVNLYMDDDEFDFEDPFGNRLRMDLDETLLQIKDTYGQWHINKMSCATEVSKEAREECFALLEPDYELLIHNEYVVELVPKGHNKGMGIEKVCQLLDLDIKDCYAIGDSVNDLDMLNMAGHSIAMGNGTDEAKNAADFVTTALDDDGIYNALKHFELI